MYMKVYYRPKVDSNSGGTTDESDIEAISAIVDDSEIVAEYNDPLGYDVLVTEIKPSSVASERMREAAQKLHEAGYEVEDLYLRSGKHDSHR